MKGAEDSSEAIRILNLPRGTIRYLNNKYHFAFLKPEPDKALTLRSQILRWKSELNFDYRWSRAVSAELLPSLAEKEPVFQAIENLFTIYLP